MGSSGWEPQQAFYKIETRNNCFDVAVCVTFLAAGVPTPRGCPAFVLRGGGGGGLLITEKHPKTGLNQKNLKQEPDIDLLQKVLCGVFEIPPPKTPKNATKQNKNRGGRHITGSPPIFLLHAFDNDFLQKQFPRSRGLLCF
jgi:hypothetical protein